MGSADLAVLFSFVWGAASCVACGLPKAPSPSSGASFELERTCPSLNPEL